MSDSRFYLMPHLDALSDDQPRYLAFRATTLAEHEKWRSALKQKVMEKLGILGRCVPEKPAVEELESIDKGEYVQKKYALDVGEGVETPIYLLVPKTPPPYKPIMVFHGHSPSVQYVLGNFPTPELEKQKLAFDADYAAARAREGYLVCAVEQRGFGERQSSRFLYRKEGTEKNSCRHLFYYYLMEGRNLLGERCWDGMCAISYVLGRDDVAPETLGCTGNSGGGTTTLWLSAIDERITCAIPSSHFGSFRRTCMNVYHCHCNYVPGIREWCETGDLAAMIAPRALRVISGVKDGLFPIDSVREEIAVAQKAYDLLGAPEACTLAEQPQGHRYHHGFAQEWFDRWL